jgi:hypothetical protein
MAEDVIVYFGKLQTRKFTLPSTKDQYIEHRKLDEEQRQNYEDATSRKMTVKEGNEVELEVLTGSDRKSLFDNAVVGYNVYVMEGGKPVLKSGYNKADWDKLQKEMDAELGQKLLEDIRDFNPWLVPADSKKK